MDNDIFKQIEEARRRGLHGNNGIEDARRAASELNNHGLIPTSRHLNELKSLRDNSFSHISLRDQFIDNLSRDNLAARKAMDSLAKRSLQSPIDSLGLRAGETYHQSLKALHDNYNFPKAALGIPFNKINDEIIAAKNFRQDYENSILRQAETARATLSQNSVFGNSVYDESQRWAKKINDLGRSDDLMLKRNAYEAATAFQVGIETVTRKINHSTFLQNHHALAEKIIEPEIAYGRFARRMLNRIEQTSDPRKEFAYTAALNLATHQISLVSPRLEQFNLSRSALVESAQYHTELNLFERQRYDLRGAADEIAQRYNDTASETDDFVEINLTEFSSSAQIAEKARHLIDLILKCNEQSGLKGTGDIFKTTNMTVEAACRLPLIIAVDKDSLGVVVDYLYFSIYEGAGKDNLRFITNGYMTSDEMDAVMWVKFLRNKWLRHDRDHGKESDVKKTWRDLNKALNALGFDSLPEKTEDFARLQYNLFEQLKSFMESLVERIKSKNK